MDVKLCLMKSKKKKKKKILILKQLKEINSTFNYVCWEKLH